MPPSLRLLPRSRPFSSTAQLCLSHCLPFCLAFCCQGSLPSSRQPACAPLCWAERGVLRRPHFSRGAVLPHLPGQGRPLLALYAGRVSCAGPTPPQHWQCGLRVQQEALHEGRCCCCLHPRLVPCCSAPGCSGHCARQVRCRVRSQLLSGEGWEGALGWPLGGAAVAAATSHPCLATGVQLECCSAGQDGSQASWGQALALPILPTLPPALLPLLRLWWLLHPQAQLWLWRRWLQWLWLCLWLLWLHSCLAPEHPVPPGCPQQEAQQHSPHCNASAASCWEGGGSGGSNGGRGGEG